jgi:hypothetical protein
VWRISLAGLMEDNPHHDLNPLEFVGKSKTGNVTIISATIEHAHPKGTGRAGLQNHAVPPARSTDPSA